MTVLINLKKKYLLSPHFVNSVVQTAKNTIIQSYELYIFFHKSVTLCDWHKTSLQKNHYHNHFLHFI